MHVFRVYFTAEDPLVISNGTAEGMKHTCLSHIPGSMLLGSMAVAWKKNQNITMHHKSDDNSEFAALFLQGKVSWGHALPVCDNRPCMPIPLCWEYIKDNGRLPLYNSKELSSATIFNLLRTPGDIENIDTANLQEKLWKETINSHQKRKKVPEGFVDMQSFCAPSVTHQRTTHIALDTLKRTAQDKQLYAYEAIARGTKFCSTIACTSEWIESLRSLLSATPHICVGHSRSAGYGDLRLTHYEECTSEEYPSEITITQGEHILFLTSDYFPKQSWKKPLDALQQEIENRLGNVTWKPEKNFCKDIRLESFHGQWRLPRPTRHGLQAGSVISFTCFEQGTLPTHLGNWQQEGFGRVLLNPSILQDLLIKPKPCEDNFHPMSTSTAISWPFLPVWRKRSLTRIAAEQAHCIWQRVGIWSHFFNDLAKDTKISQSQRSNIRNLISTKSEEQWKKSFESILSKTPGKQWENAIAHSPFSKRREHVNTIMLCLLDREECTELIENQCKDDCYLPSVAGGVLTDKEAEMFRTLRHKRLLLEILRRWEKDSRHSAIEGVR